MQVNDFELETVSSCDVFFSSLIKARKPYKSFHSETNPQYYSRVDAFKQYRIFLALFSKLKKNIKKKEKRIDTTCGFRCTYWPEIIGTMEKKEGSSVWAQKRRLTAFLKPGRRITRQANCFSDFSLCIYRSMAHLVKRLPFFLRIISPSFLSFDFSNFNFKSTQFGKFNYWI